MNTTDKFVRNIFTFSKQEFPDHILHQVKRCVLDYIGVTYAGAFSVKEKMEAFISSCSTMGSCSLIGFEKKVDIYTAGLVNGFTSHTIELDDGHRFGMLHLEAPIISAMLVVAQHEKMDARQFIKGVITGYEATVRLAIAVQPKHKQKGFHATGTCGAIGVACAVAVALNFTEYEMQCAISAAATSAAGLLEVIDDASQLKPYNIAHAVSAGISAAYIGGVGFSGPDDVLAGKRGFFAVLNDEFDESALTAVADSSYAIEKIYVKPYAACRHCHSAIECGLNLSKENAIDWKKIKHVQVQTYKLGVSGHNHTLISGVSSAKMSTPYSVAAAIILQDAGVEAFREDTVNREDILTLCKCVSVVENPKLTAASPEKRGAIVTIIMDEGTEYSNRVEYPLGEPENYISDGDLEKKYKSLMRLSGVFPEEIEKISHLVWDIENSFEELLSKL